MKSNILLGPFCRYPYPFVKSCPDKYMQSVSFLDDSSRKYKDKTSGKTVDTNIPKMITLNTYDIIGLTFLMPPQ